MRVRIFCRKDSCEFFPAFATNPQFQNPFKYKRRFDLNHETVHFSRGRASLRLAIYALNQ